MFLFFAARHLSLFFLRKVPIDNSPQPVSHGRVKVRYQEKDGYTTGMSFLSPDTLIVCDSSSFAVKVVNTNTRELTAYLTVPASPRGISAMSPTQAAVTLPYIHCIQIVNYYRDELVQLTAIDTDRIPVEGACSGIDYDRENKLFAVTFTDPPKVQLIDRQGNILNTLANESASQPVLNRPLYVRFNNTSSRKQLYVTDVNLNRLLEIDIRNELIVFEKKIDNIEQPRDMYVLPNNELFICGHYSHSLGLVSELGEYKRTLVSQTDGLEFPCAMTYSEQDKTVYISGKRIGAGPDLWDNIKYFTLDQQQIEGLQ